MSRGPLCQNPLTNQLTFPNQLCSLYRFYTIFRLEIRSYFSLLVSHCKSLVKFELIPQNSFHIFGNLHIDRGGYLNLGSFKISNLPSADIMSSMNDNKCCLLYFAKWNSFRDKSYLWFLTAVA